MIFIQIIALLFLSISSGICGSISVWNRNLFFNHIFSHSLLLPPALCVAFGIHSDSIILFVSILFAITFSLIFSRMDGTLLSDKSTVLLISSLVFTAISIILSSRGNIHNLMSFVVGDIFFINIWQVVLMGIIACLYTVYICKYYNIIILSTISKDIAKLQMSNINIISTFEIVIQSVLIVLSSRIFGSLLTSGALIIPSVLSQLICNTPKQMVIVSILLSCATGVISLAFGTYYGIHIASLIVILYCVLTILVLLWRYLPSKFTNSP